MINLTRNHPRKRFHYSANYLHSPKAQALPKMFTETPQQVLLGLKHTLSLISISLLCSGNQIDPQAQQSYGIQPRASHHKALTCYPPTDLLISFLTKTIYLPTKEKKDPKITRSRVIQLFPDLHWLLAQACSHFVPSRSLCQPPSLVPPSIRLHQYQPPSQRNSQHTHQNEDSHALHAVVMGRRHNKSAGSIMHKTQDNSSVHTGLTTYFRITQKPHNMFASDFTFGYTHGWETFPKCRGRLISYRLIQPLTLGTTPKECPTLGLHPKIVALLINVNM